MIYFQIMKAFEGGTFTLPVSFTQKAATFVPQKDTSYLANRGSILQSENAYSENTRGRKCVCDFKDFYFRSNGFSTIRC